MPTSIWKRFLAGLAVLIPTWATVMILWTLFTTLDNVIGRYMSDPKPGIGIVLLIGILILSGIVTDHVVGHSLMRRLEERLERIPLVQSIYLTLKGMTDVLNFRSRFGKSTVVAFPFPRDGLWALGFVMGTAPNAIQIAPTANLVMVFVPTAIHPFTGYLAFIPEQNVHPINLPPEDAMKLEFSAGFYKAKSGWLDEPHSHP